jgi:hypothetical protein
MTSMTLLLTVSVFVILVARVVTNKAHKYNDLEQFKGPWSSGFSRLWLLKANASGEMHKYFTEVNDQYGA